MSKGYVIYSQGSYNEMADLLRRSIESSQSLIKDVHIIAGQDADIMYDRTKVYEQSPFDETVMLDADMLFLTDVSHWWNHFSQFPLLITNKVKTYRGDWVVDTPYRNYKVKEDLPTCYCAVTYFKKDPLSEDFFNLLGRIVKNWTYQQYQDKPSIDIAMSIACDIMGIKPFSPLNYPTFTHMKSGCQGWTRYTEDWQSHVALSVEPGLVKIGNYNQTGILHYVDKGLVSELSKAF